jgi:hypothetical protein
MKKLKISRLLLGLMSGLCLLLAGCGQTISGLSEGTYAAKKTKDAMIQPTITFDLKENTFDFSYDPLSSYVSYGSIAVDGGMVTAKTEDGTATYRFQIVDNDTIRFVQSGSSPVVTVEGKSPVPDGTEFHLEVIF